MLINDKIQIEKCYNAVKQRDSSYIGSFFFGVRTTGIFCIPSCRARTPKQENLVFYTHVNELLQEGYRPCKICKPTFNAYETPADVKKAIQLVHDSPFVKIKDTDLLNNKIRPEKVRRWFKKNYGITFQAYQRMFRINNAYNQLLNGTKVTESAFDSGYDSLSGFAYTFKTLMGKEPQKGKSSNVITLKRITTPVGPMYIAADKHGICMLEFVDRKSIENEILKIQKIRQAPILIGQNNHIKEAEKQIVKYFEGKLKYFTLSISYIGNKREIDYWEKIKQIPYGETKTYSQLAKEMGLSFQKIRKLNGLNKIAILIPCHRLIEEDGNLLGYGGGIERKKWMLNLEKKNA